MHPLETVIASREILVYVKDVVKNLEKKIQKSFKHKENV